MDAAAQATQQQRRQKHEEALELLKKQGAMSEQLGVQTWTAGEDNQQAEPSQEISQAEHTSTTVRSSWRRRQFS